MSIAGLSIFLIIAQLGVAFVLTLAIRKISATVGLLLFFAYAALTGVTLGFILVAYELGSVLAAGSSAAAVFGAAAIYGAVTSGTSPASVPTCSWGSSGSSSRVS